MELPLLYSPLFAPLLCPLCSDNGGQWRAMEREIDGDQGDNRAVSGGQGHTVREIEARPTVIRNIQGWS